MSNEDEPVDGPNPELYDRLSTPYLTQEDADRRLLAFLRKVQQLREEMEVSDVVVMCTNHYEKQASAADDPGDKVSSVRTLALGHPDIHAELGALAYQHYTLPLIQRASKLAKIAVIPEKK